MKKLSLTAMMMLALFLLPQLGLKAMGTWEKNWREDTGYVTEYAVTHFKRGAADVDTKRFGDQVNPNRIVVTVGLSLDEPLNSKTKLKVIIAASKMYGYFYHKYGANLYGMMVTVSKIKNYRPFGQAFTYDQDAVFITTLEWSKYSQIDWDTVSDVQGMPLIWHVELIHPLFDRN